MRSPALMVDWCSMGTFLHWWLVGCVKDGKCNSSVYSGYAKQRCKDLRLDGSSFFVKGSGTAGTFFFKILRAWVD